MKGNPGAGPGKRTVSQLWFYFIRWVKQFDRWCVDRVAAEAPDLASFTLFKQISEHAFYPDTAALKT